MDWLYAAGSLPGQCLAVGVVLWHEAGMANGPTVQFRPSKMVKFDMHRDTACRALKRLQAAGLIAIEPSKPGRCLEVRLLDVQTAV